MAESGQGYGPTMTTTHEGGMRYVAEIRGHRVVTDQPAHGGGADAAAMPLELLGAALSTCIALYVDQFLKARALPAEGLRVELVASMSADRPRRIGRYDVTVHLPEGVPSSVHEMIERVAVSCPAHATLSHSPQIEVSLEPAGAGVA